MISRRNFLKGAIATLCGSQLKNLQSAFASTGLESTKERVLKLYNIHTGERLHTCYLVGGKYIQDEVNRINHFLRCHYTNVVKPISIQVIDLLCEIKNCFAGDMEINIISGYRSPKYNNRLRSHGRQVAEGSLHLHGLAIDFAIPGIRTEKLAKAAVQFQAGGVGLYPEFVHIDVGKVRRW
ncbi:MAG: DUF882 domain-containing protein [Syntrophorhabdus sp.]